MEKRETQKVRLFGRFEIQHGEGAEARVLTERDSTSKLLWTFLEYLVVYHKRGVTQEELIEALVTADRAERLQSGAGVE